LLILTESVAFVIATPPENEGFGTTLIWVPVISIFVPSVILPAPENCVNWIESVPISTTPSFIHTHPLSALTVPS
jgi:hypothetical protein